LSWFNRKARAEPQQAVAISDNDSQFVEKVCDSLGLSAALQSIAFKKFAIDTAINLITGTVSGCEFKTFINGIPVKNAEYFLWNYEPNINQNSTQFIQEFLYKLLYKNECLIVDVGGQLIIADSFQLNEYAVIESTFTNVSRGTLTFSKAFRASEVLYFKYNNDNIRSLLGSVNSSCEELIAEAISKYKASGGEKIILQISTQAAGAPNFEQKLEKLMTERFKTFFNSKNAVLPLTEGYSANRQAGETNKKSSNEISDVKSLIDNAFALTANAFKIPVAILKGDIADVDKITDNYLTFCIKPLCDIISEEITRKRYGSKEFLKGSYLAVDTTCVKNINIFDKAEKIDKLIACGAYSIDEVREKAGDFALNTEFSQKHYITKNYGEVTGGGGENNG